MKQKIIILICLSFWVLPAIASAQNQVPNRPGLAAKASATVAAVKGAINRCPVVESKLQVKVTNFDNIKVKHLEIYNRVRANIGSLIEKLAANGVDVTRLKADLAVLDQKIKKFSDDYAIYIGKLKDSQAFVCGKSEGDFRNKLKESKAALAQVHKDAVDIRTYYAQTIKPEINRIRALIRNQKSTTTPDVDAVSEPVIDDVNN